MSRRKQESRAVVKSDASIHVEFAKVEDLPETFILQSQIDSFCEQRITSNKELGYFLNRRPDYGDCRFYCGDLHITLSHPEAKSTVKIRGLVPIDDQDLVQEAFNFVPNTPDQKAMLKTHNREKSSKERDAEETDHDDVESEFECDPSEKKDFKCEKICVSFKPLYRETAMLANAMDFIMRDSPDMSQGEKTSIEALLVTLHLVCFHQIKIKSKIAMQKAFQCCKQKWNIIVVFLGASLNTNQTVWEKLARDLGKQPENFDYKKRRKIQGLLAPPVRDSSRLGFISWCASLIESSTTEMPFQTQMDEFDFSSIHDTFEDWIGVIAQPFPSGTVQALDSFRVWYALQMFAAKALESYDLEQLKGAYHVLKEKIQDYQSDSGTPPTMFNPEVSKKCKASLCYFIDGQTTTLKNVDLKSLPRETLVFVKIGDSYYGVVIQDEEVRLSQNPLFKTDYRWSSSTRHSDKKFNEWVQKVKDALDNTHHVQSLVLSLMDYCPELMYHFIRRKKMEQATEIWKGDKEKVLQILDKGIFKTSLRWIQKLSVDEAKILAIYLLEGKLFEKYHLFHCYIANSQTICFMVSPMARAMNAVTYTPSKQVTSIHSGYLEPPMWHSVPDASSE